MLLKNWQQLVSLLSLSLIVMQLLFLFVVLLCLPLSIPNLILSQVFFYFFYFLLFFFYNYKKNLIFTIGVLIIDYMLQMIMSLLRNFALISSSFRTVISSSSGDNVVHFYAIYPLYMMTLFG